MTHSQIHLIAWTLVMVVQIAHGHFAARKRADSDVDPPRKHYPFLVHALIAAVIAGLIAFAADALGWVEN